MQFGPVAASLHLLPLLGMLLLLLLLGILLLLLPQLGMVLLLLLEGLVVVLLGVLMVHVLLACVAPTVLTAKLLLQTGPLCTRKRRGASDLRLSMGVRRPYTLRHNSRVCGLRSGKSLVRRVPLKLLGCALLHGRGGSPKHSTPCCCRLRTVMAPMTLLLYLHLRVVLLTLLRPLLLWVKRLHAPLLQLRLLTPLLLHRLLLVSVLPLQLLAKRLLPAGHLCRRQPVQLLSLPLLQLVGLVLLLLLLLAHDDHGGVATIHALPNSLPARPDTPHLGKRCRRRRRVQHVLLLLLLVRLVVALRAQLHVRC